MWCMEHSDEHSVAFTATFQGRMICTHDIQNHKLRLPSKVCDEQHRSMGKGLWVSVLSHRTTGGW